MQASTTRNFTAIASRPVPTEGLGKNGLVGQVRQAVRPVGTAQAARL